MVRPSGTTCTIVRVRGLLCGGSLNGWRGGGGGGGTAHAG